MDTEADNNLAISSGSADGLATASDNAVAVERLLQIMRRLRDPASGCAWDIKQTAASVAPFAVEEAYEVIDAIAQGDMSALCDELGDLLLQVVFQAQIAAEAGHFEFRDVAAAISDKMVRRHPHVFANKRYANEAEQKADWQAIKAKERAARGGLAKRDVPLSLPALKRAQKLGEHAAALGFDFDSAAAARDKLSEELRELDDELAADNRQRVHEELGDVLFSVCNLARQSGIDPEASLASANQRFEQRFALVEQQAAGQALTALSAAQLEALWQAAKARTTTG